jgi:hypothetical protein
VRTECRDAPSRTDCLCASCALMRRAGRVRFAPTCTVNRMPKPPSPTVASSRCARKNLHVSTHTGARRLHHCVASRCATKQQKAAGGLRVAPHQRPHTHTHARAHAHAHAHARTHYTTPHYTTLHTSHYAHQTRPDQTRPDQTTLHNTLHTHTHARTHSRRHAYHHARTQRTHRPLTSRARRACR